MHIVVCIIVHESSNHLYHIEHNKHTLSYTVRTLLFGRHFILALLAVKLKNAKIEIENC